MKIICPLSKVEVEFPDECFNKRCEHLYGTAYGYLSDGKRVFVTGKCKKMERRNVS